MVIKYLKNYDVSSVRIIMTSLMQLVCCNVAMTDGDEILWQKESYAHRPNAEGSKY